MFLNKNRKEYESIEEAPPFVQEQLKEYIFWIKNLRLMQAYISKRLKKSEETMEIMHANYNDRIVEQCYDIEDEMYFMTEIISRQLNCLSKEEIRKFTNAELSNSEPAILKINKK